MTKYSCPNCKNTVEIIPIAEKVTCGCGYTMVEQLPTKPELEVENA